MCSYAINHNDCKTFFRNLLRLEKPRYATLSRPCRAQERDCTTTSEKSSPQVQQHAQSRHRSGGFQEKAGNPRSDRLYQGSSRASCRKSHRFSISSKGSVVLLATGLPSDRSWAIGIFWPARIDLPLASGCGSTKNPKAAHLAVRHRTDQPGTTDRSRTKDSPACNR